MTHPALAGLLARLGRPRLGAPPTVAATGTAMVEFFTRVQEAADAPAFGADERDHEEQTEQIRRAKAIALLRSAVVGTLQAIRPGQPVQDEPDQYAYRHREPSLAQRLFGGSPQQSRPLPPPEPVVVADLLFQQIEAAFDSADELLELSKPPEPVVLHRPWAEDKELVELIHQLLEAASAGDGDHLLRLVAGLRKDLAAFHDIRVVDFADADAQHFGPVEDGGEPGATYRTLRPALLHAGRLLRRGQAAVDVPQQAPSPDDTTQRAEEQEVTSDGEDH